MSDYCLKIIIHYSNSQLSEEERECLTSAWPPLDSGKVGDCGDDSAIIYQGSVQGNCIHDYEKFSDLVRYYLECMDVCFVLASCVQMHAGYVL